MNGRSLTILVACALLAFAEDWPQFRGPSGSGISQHSRIPVEFGPAKNLSWKVAVGPGHSSPVVCGNHLYLTSFDNDALRTYAFDVRTGKALWSRDLPRNRKAKHHSLNSPASPSPACDNSGVIVFFADFGLAFWTRDGKPGWRIPMAAVVNTHGVSSSPVMAGNMVIQVHGSDSGSGILVYDRSSGKQIWQDKLAGVTYSTPAVTPDAQVFVVSTGEVISFDLRTGRRRWWMMGVPYQPRASPVLSADGGLVYLPCCR